MKCQEDLEDVMKLKVWGKGLTIEKGMLATQKTCVRKRERERERERVHVCEREITLCVCLT